MPHTKGEWKFEYMNDGLWVYSHPDEPVICDLVARLSSYDESNKTFTEQFQPEDEANAKLIAAAPDMLTALQKICEMNYRQAQDQYGDKNKAKQWACVRVAEAAISKATL